MKADHPRLLAALIAAALTFAAATPAMAQATTAEKPMKMMSMGDEDLSAIPRIPPVAGYAAGERICFLHTEVSDPEIGGKRCSDLSVTHKSTVCRDLLR